MATQAELITYLTEVRTAKSALILGKRVGEVTYQGRKVSYTEVTLPQLDEEEKRLNRQLARFNRPRYSLFSTGKGL